MSSSIILILEYFLIPYNQKIYKIYIYIYIYIHPVLIYHIGEVWVAPYEYDITPLGGSVDFVFVFCFCFFVFVFVFVFVFFLFFVLHEFFRIFYIRYILF